MIGSDHGESIYNLVYEEPPKPEKPPLYRSKHSGKCAPTGSTFGTAQTSKPGIVNLGGEANWADSTLKSQHTYKKGKANFGPALNGAKPNPGNFLKSKEHTTTIPSLDELKATGQADTLKPTKLKEKVKPALPTGKDAPIHGLQTSKNFIVANAVEVILAAPKKTHNEAQDFMAKEDYGKTPAYLVKIKQDIEAEYDYIRKLREEEAANNEQARPLNSEEREALIAGMKAKWEQINTEYQASTHLTKLDTIGKIRRKEKHEKGLVELEESIEKLRRENIVIALDA